MAEAVQEAPKTAKEVIRYATEQLHAVRPQPAGIPEMLAALRNSLVEAEEDAKAEKEEQPPKTVDEAIGRIDAMVGKMEHPPKEKADLKAIARPAEGGQGPATTQEGKPAGTKVGSSAAKNG
jgi:hypothetical protein